MSKVLVASINQIATEKDLDREVIFTAIEAALVSAYKRKYGGVANISSKVDRLNGEMSVFTEREVVDDVFNLRTEIGFKDARKLQAGVQLGDVILVESKPDDFGRIAAQTAKQVILQRIREAERDTVFENFAHKVNEVLTSQVRSIDQQSGAITLVLEDKHEVLLMKEEQIPTEKLRRGDFVKVYVVDVHKSTRGPVIKLSRTHRNLLRRLMEMEIPEVRDGIVEIKAIAREPGQRSKAAVIATRPNVDPVGSCVGPRGLRIQNIVTELAGEKIDVVEWSNDPAKYISHALSPAKITHVLPDEKANVKTAIVVVPDKQLSLAIGKEGQNARLAAKLTGWRIDIKSESEAAAEGLTEIIAERLQRAKGGDLFSLAESLLKGEEIDTEARLMQAVKSLGESKALPTEFESFSEEDDDASKRARKVAKKPKAKSATGLDDFGSELGEESVGIGDLSNVDFDALFQRGLDAAARPPSEASRPTSDLFSQAAAAVGKFELPKLAGDEEFTFDSFDEEEPVRKVEEPVKPEPVKPEPVKAEAAVKPAVPVQPVAEAKPETPVKAETKGDELPQVITAAMLRERMAQRKQMNLNKAEIEVPEELLAGYEATDEELEEEEQRDKVTIGAVKKPAAGKVVDKKPKKKKRRSTYVEEDDDYGQFR